MVAIDGRPTRAGDLDSRMPLDGQLAVGIAQLVMHMLRVLAVTVRAKSAHRTDGIARGQRLAFFHLECVQVQDLVRVTLRIVNLDRAVVAARERYRSGDRRMHRRVLQVTALLTTFVVEICTTVRPVATAVLTIMTGNVRVGAALTGQHAFHRLPKLLRVAWLGSAVCVTGVG